MISAIVEETYSGAWVADTVDTVAPIGSVPMPGTDPWSGTIVTTSQDGGRFYSRIVGGKGKLGSDITDKWYNGTLLADTVVADAVKESGETFGASSIGVRIDSWQRKAGSLGDALSQLVAVTGGVWWVARDGSVNVAQSRSGNVVVPSSVTRVATDVDGSISLNLNTAIVKPGDTWLGNTIRHVRHVLTSNTFSSQISFTDLPDLRLGLDYLRTYSARVDKQNSDGTLDVIVNGQFSVTSVRWLAGVPAKVVVNPGDFVTLGWLGGDPRAPYSSLLEQTAGTKAAAGIGDTVDCGYLILPIQSFGTGTVTIPPAIYFPPGPDAAFAADQVANIPPYGAAIHLQGVITSGQSRILL
jgi:hypothetical protein